MTVSELVSRYTIKELPEEERPREKFLTQGPEVMSNAELLAILLRTGTTKESALRLAELILVNSGGLYGLGSADVSEITRIKGVGPAKAISVAAAVELGKRLNSKERQLRNTICSPHDVAELMMPRMRYESKEKFAVILLSSKSQVIKISTISIGTLNASLVHPRELFKEAILNSAASVILVHNHPSGDPIPSKEDISLTERMAEAGQLLDISVIDHIIIGDGKYFSLKEKGIL